MKPFHLGAISGTIAATTTGVVFAWRSATPNWQYIERFKFALEPIAAPGAAAPVTLELALQDVFTADYTGGTDISDRTGAGAADYALTARIRDALRITTASQTPISAVGAGDIRIATTAALGGGGGGTPRTQPWSHGGKTFGTSNNDPLVIEWSKPESSQHHQHPHQGCLILPPDTGFVVRIPVNADASLTLRLSGEVEFLEL